MDCANRREVTDYYLRCERSCWAIVSFITSLGRGATMAALEWLDGAKTRRLVSRLVRLAVSQYTTTALKVRYSRRDVIRSAMLLAVLASCVGTDASSSPVAGGLYAVRGDSGGYDVVKVLVVDSSAVHVRIYSDHFAELPERVDPAALHLYGLKAPGSDATSQAPTPRLGIGHLPITPSQFAAWQPHLVQRDSVREAELEGYRMWKEAGGGVFP